MFDCIPDRALPWVAAIGLVLVGLVVYRLLKEFRWN